MVDWVVNAARLDGFYLSHGFSNGLLNRHIYLVGFTNQEKVKGLTDQMFFLHLPDGTPTTDQGEMKRHAVEFYSALYWTEDCSRGKGLV